MMRTYLAWWCEVDALTTGCEFQTGGTGTTDGMEPDAPDAPPDAPPDAVPPTVAHGCVPASSPRRPPHNP